MSSLPRNKWISYGLALFIGFIIVVLFSFATIDISFNPTGVWVLQGLGLILPILSFVLSLYGLFVLNKTKESGTAEAIVIVIVLGVFGVYMAYNFLT